MGKILKYLLYFLVFLLPLFFLPFSFEGYEFNKQYLLFFLVSLTFLFWIAKMVLCQKEIRFRRTPLDIPVLVFMFFSILSAVFSVDKTSSIFGFYGRFSDNLVGILSLGLFYFLITNNVGVKNKSITNNFTYNLPITIDGLLKIFSYSAFFVLLISYFSLFGVWQILLEKFSVILPMISQNRIFNPIGASLESLVMFLTVLIVLLVGLILQNKESKLKNVYFSFLLFASIILLILIDFASSWFVLGLTLILFLVFAFWSRIFRERVNLLLIPLILIILSILFSFATLAKYNLSIKEFNILNPPKEILLDQKTTWKVTWETIKKYPFLGSGLGTFSFDFSKFKPKEFNQTNLWQWRFDKGKTQIAENLATMGILGFLSWLAIVSLFFIISYFLLQSIKFRKKEDKNYSISLIFTFLALFLTQFFYYQNTTLGFLFWLILGLGVISWDTPLKEKIISFKNFPEMSLIFNVILIIFILIIFIGWFFGIKFYLADIKYKNGILSNKIEILEKAVNLNPSRSIYKINLSRIYLTEALNELQKLTDQQDVQKIQLNFAKAIDEARKSTQVSPNWVVAFENLGIIYREIQNLAQGASEWAINAFSKAAELEPTNPAFPTEIGKILRNEQKIEEAKKQFEKALELKPDYLDAKIQLAIIFELEGNFNEAISRLKKIVEENPLNVEALFQLGRIYYNNNQIEEAISPLEQAIQIFPNHSNSLYVLGMIYQMKGQKEEALKMFEKVLELNPGNQDIISKIENLKKEEKKEEK